MAMYYQGSSEIQADGLQTLYLMNPNYIGYTDTHQQQHPQQQQHIQPASMFFLNSATAGNLTPHAPIPSQAHGQHFVGVPLPASMQDPSRAPSVHEVSASGLLQRLWSSADQNSGDGGENGSQSHIPSSTVVSPNSGMGPTTDFTSQLGFQRPGLVLSPMQQQHQGLSLSLSPQQQQQQQQQLNFRSVTLDHHEVSPHDNHQAGILSSQSPRTNTSNNNDNIRATGASSAFSFSNGMILGSKYLKAAQELLDEVANVEKNIKLADRLEGNKEKHKLENELMDSDVGVPTSGSGESSSQKNSVVVELTTAQRQELQMKKAKLVSMLDEVEQRYRQYHHQMQIIVASFEQAAGIGSAKSYTQLALHTISKQFRCLKDAITGQIKATTKSLGEEESLGGKIEGTSSRLKFVDHHLRQQRALQQLGMIQPNAWRPQRGLPERAVSVLRAWLFEHFLHPYPKDSDKIMLAKQTGLTRSQVSNWFINARVRLWKPMVEEMYMEEVKNNEGDQNGLEENTNNKEETSKHRKDNNNNNMQDASPTDISTSTISTSPTGASLPPQASGFSFIGSLNMDNTAERNNKKPRNDLQNSSSSILSVDTEMKGLGEMNKGEKFNNDRQTRESYPLMNAYTMGEFGRFNPDQMATSFQGNGVSLTLGLPPSENLAALPGTHHQHNFLPNQNIGLGRIESHYNRMSNPQASSHPNISYENIDFQSGKRYAAQLLPDFVS